VNKALKFVSYRNAIRRSPIGLLFLHHLGYNGNRNIPMIEDKEGKT
jgi:hypothetical protein